MKKISTFLAAIATCLSLSAGNFQLYFGDKPVVDGGSYERGYTLEYEEEYDGIMYRDWIQDSDIFFHATPGTSITVSVTTDNPVAMCSITGQCAMMKAGQTETRTGVLTDAVTSAQIHATASTEGDESPEDYFKVVNLTIKAYETSNPAGAVTITVKLNNVPQSEVGGIGSVASDKGYIKVINGSTLNYSVERPTTLAIYAITGNQVAKYNISNAGSLSLTGLPKGIYIYTDGKHKGKVIIR